MATLSTCPTQYISQLLISGEMPAATFKAIMQALGREQYPRDAALLCKIEGPGLF